MLGDILQEERYKYVLPLKAWDWIEVLQIDKDIILYKKSHIFYPNNTLIIEVLITMKS